MATPTGRSALDAAVGVALPVRPEGLTESALALVRGAILPATLEELFFRGLVFEGVRRLKGDTTALLVSAGLFGLAHPGLAHSAAAGLLGLYLGILRLHWGLALPIAAHALNNALALRFGPAGTSGENLRENALTDPWLWLALGLVGSSIAALRQEMRSKTRAL